MEGVLSKWTNVMKGWQYRFFVLDENSGLLSYYTSKEKMMKGVRRGCVRLKGAVIGIDDQEDNTFTITVDHKTFHFQARDADEREKWVRRLEDTIRRHISYRGGKNWEQTNVYGTEMTCQESTRRSNLQSLDKRISEADCYLQLMIEQTNKLELKIFELSNADERAKCKSLQDNANAMLDHIKHSIVTLQIAKNMANPINGIYQGPSFSGLKNDENNGLSDNASTELPPVGIPNIHNGIEYGSECLEFNKNYVHMMASRTPMEIIVPETSYSSSENEDDFFDANDFDSTRSSPIFNTRTLSEAETSKSREQVARNEGQSSTPGSDRLIFTDAKSSPTQQASNSLEVRKNVSFLTDGNLDYDALYEDDDDTDLSMESHGSVVSHLLSQVKIGMDLTKVVLPTFILERRSLLEMYADYFAHPDLFLGIADLEDPRDRIVEVCRWYLSSYHAGRKSSVAKKPYNPILGEVFCCHWDISDENSDSTVVSDGPIPSCKRDQLVFLAEQVSHHPPISAFYAEHYNKKISFAAHVWTKSKFLGLSIGVQNIGQGIVTLCDRNEEYILTFPNGYGRSILTVPWIELGGSVTINCHQTGYYADVEFLTKPFYGGKRNKVTAEIYAPNDKKPFVSIAGEWSGLMEAKWHDGSRNKTEVFIDVNKIPIHKKIIKPIIEQEEYESRKVWKEVTAGLKLNDIDRATSAKSQVEQKQRDEAKIRKDNEGTWDTKHFKPIGDSWIYIKPLSQRLYIQEKENKR